jgi:hypothetical protein
MAARYRLLTQMPQISQMAAQNLRNLREKDAKSV